MAGFKFRLYLDNGEDIGTFETGVPNWDVGMEFISGDHTTFRILKIVPEIGDDSPFAGVFVVAPVALAEPG